MGGRLHVRRPIAMAIPVAVLALVLVLLPSLGSRLVPTAVVSGASPAATVVHLLGDEIAPASIAAAPERRSRPDAPDLALSVLAGAVGIVAVLTTSSLGRRRRPAVVPVRWSAPSGRSPPSRFPVT